MRHHSVHRDGPSRRHPSVTHHRRSVTCEGGGASHQRYFHNRRSAADPCQSREPRAPPGKYLYTHSVSSGRSGRLTSGQSRQRVQSATSAANMEAPVGSVLLAALLLLAGESLVDRHRGQVSNLNEMKMRLLEGYRCL